MKYFTCFSQLRRFHVIFLEYLMNYLQMCDCDTAYARLAIHLAAHKEDALWDRWLCEPYNWRLQRRFWRPVGQGGTNGNVFFIGYCSHVWHLASRFANEWIRYWEKFSSIFVACRWIREIAGPVLSCPAVVPYMIWPKDLKWFSHFVLNAVQTW